MKIYRFDEFVEKIAINPIHISDLDQISSEERTTKPGSGDDWYEKMRGKDTTSGYYSLIRQVDSVKRAYYDEGKFKKALDDTFKRFSSWKDLSFTDLLKKHEQRANKSMTPEKRLACFYESLVWYGPVKGKVYGQTNVENKKIVEYYHDMLLRNGFTDDEIYKIFIK